MPARTTPAASITAASITAAAPHRTRAARLVAAGLLAGAVAVTGTGPLNPAAAAGPAAGTGPAGAGAAGTAPARPGGNRQLPPVIGVPGNHLAPEGVAWDPTRHAFLVSSVTTGTVSVVTPDGVTRPLISDPALVSTFGLLVDPVRRRVLVTYGDLGLSRYSSPETVQKLSGLLIADLGTGRVIHRVDLGGTPGAHAANDVAIDPRGTAYVTDTLGAALLAVDTRGRVLSSITDPRFVAQGFGLNGVVWHPGGFLLVTRYDSGALFRVGPDGRHVEEVSLAAALPGADGLALRADGSLVVVTNSLGGAGTDAVHVLRTGPGRPWTAAREVRTVTWPDRAPTTAADTGDGTFVLSGRLDLVVAGDPSAAGFTLRRLP